MLENFDYVQKGLRLLLSPFSGYIGKEMSSFYGNNWWNEVLEALSDQRNLPLNGSYGELIDSLDLANCIRILDRRWYPVFERKLNMSYRNWARELMGVRNIVAHYGQSDLEQQEAERALDTMRRICEAFDSEVAEKITDLYREIRARANDVVIKKIYHSTPQPESISNRGELEEGNILKIDDESLITKTNLTKKVTFAGKTEIYPVFRVNLDLLYYNDQNDRIATWISKYESENGKDSLKGIDTKLYNRIIENFICESNPDAIKKTQKNISLVGQQEPGVTLSDGRVVDGNRRLTCIRRLRREGCEPSYFETVIMDADINEDKKQIKLLELSIQYGEEKKIDYDAIDYAIGTYRDIIKTNLITVEEYARSTNEGNASVNKRIKIAKIITEFLEYIKLPEQYHIAKEYQVYDLFAEMIPLLNKLDDEEKKELKEISFSNLIIKTIKDQRKFIRDIKNLINKESYKEYFDEQKGFINQIKEKINDIEISDKNDLDDFAAENENIALKMSYSLEKALQKFRSKEAKFRPVENVSKSINLLMDIDTRMFDRMNPEEKAELKSTLQELSKIVEKFKEKI